MKVALIIERADTGLGGAERSVFELQAALRRLALDVDILAAKGAGKKTEHKNIYFLCADKGGKRTTLSRFENTLKEFLNQNHYDIIHSFLPFEFADIYQPRGGSFPEAIKRNAESYQNKSITTYKKLSAFANLRRAALYRAEKRLCENNNGPIIAALSGYVAEQFRRYYNVPDERLVIIPNGVKTDTKAEKHAADALRSQILASLRITEADNPIFFLFAANNFRLKGLGILLEAFSLASEKEEFKPAYLIVAGKGKIHKFRHLAKRFGVFEKVVFLGQVRHMANVFAVSDAAVLATFYDPSSRFTLESLAADKPVITTRFNGASELITNNRHGRIIEQPEDIEALADALLYFTNTETIEGASKAIIEDKLKEQLSVNRAAEQLLNLYEKILESKGKK